MPTPGPTDTELALLAPGEHVLNKEAVDIAGRETLDNLNAQGLKVRETMNQTKNSLQNVPGLTINPVTSPSAAPMTGVPQINTASAAAPKLPQLPGLTKQSQGAQSSGNPLYGDAMKDSLFPKPTYPGQNPVKVPGIQGFEDGGAIPSEQVQMFEDGGAVIQKTDPTLVQRLNPASQNAATQSAQLRYDVGKQGKSYLQPPTAPSVNNSVNVGPRSDYRFNPLPGASTLSPAAVDSTTVGNVASDIAGAYKGPFADKVKAFFPRPSNSPVPGSFADKAVSFFKGGIQGYEDGTPFDEDEIGKYAKKKGTVPTDTYPADPKRFGYQGVPSTKQLSTQVKTGTDILPSGERTGPSVKEPIVSKRVAAPAVEPVSNPNFTLEGGPYQNVPEKGVEPGKALAPDTQANRYARSGYNAAQQSEALRDKMAANKAVAGAETTGSPKVDPWTGKVPGGAQISQRLKDFFNPKLMGKQLANAAKDPVTAGLAAHGVNENLLNRELKSGNANPLLAGGRMILDAAGNPLKYAGQKVSADENTPLGSLIEAATPVPELAKAGYFGKPAPDGAVTEAETQEPAGVTQKAVEQSQTAAPISDVPLNVLGQPVQTLTEQGGYMLGSGKDAIHVIPWSPDTDDALQRTLPADEYNELRKKKAAYKAQTEAAVIPESNASSAQYDAKGNYLGGTSEYKRGGSQPYPEDFRAGQQGNAAASQQAEFIQKERQKIIDEQTERAKQEQLSRIYELMQDPNEEKRKSGSALLQRYFPDVYNKRAEKNIL